MAKLPDISDEDLALFRGELASVKRLRHDRVVPTPRRPAAVPRQTRLDEVQVLRDLLSDDFDPAELETGEELLFSRSGVRATVLRQLRRGQFSIGAHLDLHGMTVPQAREALVAFLTDCLAMDVRCVRIIHGKGRGSKHRQPILKGKLNLWLQQRNEILAFCSAPTGDGGTGAIYVLLKRRR